MCKFLAKLAYIGLAWKGHLGTNTIVFAADQVTEKKLYNIVTRDYWQINWGDDEER